MGHFIRDDFITHQDDREAEHPSFAVYKQNTVFIPRIYVKVVVHAKRSHVFKGVFLQLKFLNICKKDEKDPWIYFSNNSLQLTVYKHFSIGNIILLSTISLLFVSINLTSSIKCSIDFLTISTGWFWSKRTYFNFEIKQYRFSIKH